MKIFISYPITNNPSGGGNQFLRNFRDQLLLRNQLTEKPEDADVVLYNGHHEIQKTSNIKKSFPEKKYATYTIFLITKPLGLFQEDKVFFKGSLNFIISFIEFLIVPLTAHDLPCAFVAIAPPKVMKG